MIFVTDVVETVWELMELLVHEVVAAVVAVVEAVVVGYEESFEHEDFDVDGDDEIVAVVDAIKDAARYSIGNLANYGYYCC